MVVENRILITKQETELKTVKRELEETKRNCHCGSTSDEKKTTAKKVEVPKKKATLIRRGRIIPPTSHDGPVAFYGYMTTAMTNIGGHHTLIFDVIKTNSGNGLHPTTGVFMAPSSGFYVFTWTIREFDNSYHSVELVVNGQEVGALYQHAGPGEDDMSSTTVVIHVNEGEDVFLRTKMDFNQGVINSSIHGYSSFAGWKLN
ncbi:complement C1q tumor necrosis factor-related protein 3-like [Magallana gigas]|uniref:complement C1q tumor necrosis factor-related protein 3-like n=1 Tax=Magallana gigas TaxID=29159 RepID=UPI0033418A9B